MVSVFPFTISLDFLFKMRLLAFLEVFIAFIGEPLDFILIYSIAYILSNTFKIRIIFSRFILPLKY